MRSFGETGFDGSCANAVSAVRARTVVAPASAQELATGGLAERGHGASWTGRA